MKNSKVFVFGSFTEDETRFWLHKPHPESVEINSVSKRENGSLPDADGLASKSVVDQASKKEEEKVRRTNGCFKENGSLPVSESIADQSSKNPKEIKKQSSGCLKLNGSVPGADCVASKSIVNHSYKNEEDKVKNASGLKENGASSQFTGSPSLNNGEEDVLRDLVNSLRLLELDNLHENNSQLNGFQVVSSSKRTDERTGKTNSRKHDEFFLSHGLVNSGNLCYLNATLQALLSCSPFVDLFYELNPSDLREIDFPTLSAFSEFISKFGGSSSKKSITGLQTGKPFAPSMFQNVLKKFSPDVNTDSRGKSRQEDAQEFLSFVMNRMHDELLKLNDQSSKSVNPISSLISSEDGDEWETVGRKNKSAITRTQSFVPSELSEIFGGQLRSVVKAKGNKDSATVQPFLVLHLDIHLEKIHTIEDALHLFCSPENIEGYRDKIGEVNARKFVQIQTPSKVMILHLMRFSYGDEGSAKINKPVHFPLEFVLGRDVVVSPANRRKYELVATITHHGRDPFKGHYTADGRHPSGQWLRFDDASVTPIPTSRVLHDQAYVLFYQQV